MALVILRGIVPCLFLDQLKLAALAGVAVIKGALVEDYALGEHLDHGKTGMLDGPLEHFHHVLDLGRVGAGDEACAGRHQFLHRVYRLVHGSAGICLRPEADW